MLKWYSYEYIFGNFFVYMPINYFLIELFSLKNLKKNILISFIIILLSESIQFIFKLGVFDIDDIIVCTSGMIIFYLIYNKFFLKNKKLTYKNY